MSEKKKATQKETHPTRLRMLGEGAALLAGSVVLGFVLLALIGWLFPGHQHWPPLQPVLWVVSLAMMGGALWGAWMIVKAILGFK